MHEGALDHVGGGRLGEPVDGGEAEGERAVLERAELGGGEGSGKCQGHRARGYAPGVPVTGDQAALAPRPPPRRGPRAARSAPGPGARPWSARARRRASAAEQVGPEAVGVGAARQGDRAAHLAQAGVGVVGERVGVHLGLVLAPATQPDAAPVDGREAVVDVGGQPRDRAGRRAPCRRSWRSPRGASRIPGAGAGPRPPAGSPRGGRQGLVAGVDDGLEAVQPGEGPGPGLLGEKQGGAPARVPEPEGTLEPEVVDDGEHVGGEAVPVEVSSGGGSEAPWARSSRAKQRKLGPEMRGQGPEDRAAEAGGVGEKQRRPVAAEVVVGDAHAVGRVTRPVGRVGRRGSSGASEPTGVGHRGDATGRCRAPGPVCLGCVRPTRTGAWSTSSLLMATWPSSCSRWPSRRASPFRQR